MLLTTGQVWILYSFVFYIFVILFLFDVWIWQYSYFWMDITCHKGLLRTTGILQDNILNILGWDLYCSDLPCVPDFAALLTPILFLAICILGLYTESVSDGFKVDITAPVISYGPVFSSDFGVHRRNNIDHQFYRTSMKVQWTVDDADSYIERQYLSLKSHHGGEYDLASTKVIYILSKTKRSVNLSFLFKCKFYKETFCSLEPFGEWNHISQFKSRQNI